MHSRLSLTEYLLTIAVLILLAYGASQLVQHWLVAVTSEAFERVEREGRP